MNWWNIIKSVFFLFLIGSESLIGFSLRNTKIKKDGNGDLVSGDVYLERVVKQAGGFIIYEKNSKKALKAVKLPTYFKQGQRIVDVINNFSNLYKVVKYEFSEDKVKISVIKNKFIRQNAALNYNYKSGDIILGLGVGGQIDIGTKPLFDSDTYISFSDFPRLISGEFLFCPQLGAEISYSRFWKKDRDTYNVYEYDFFNLMAKFYLSPSGAGFFLGVGIAYYSIKYDNVDSWDGANGFDDTNWALSLTAGLNIRFGKRFILGLRYIAGLPGIQSVSGGFYVKL